MFSKNYKSYVYFNFTIWKLNIFTKNLSWWRNWCLQRFVGSRRLFPKISLAKVFYWDCQSPGCPFTTHRWTIRNFFSALRTEKWKINSVRKNKIYKTVKVYYLFFRKFLSGTWLPVCKEKFGENEAAVACRQMGFSGVAEGYPKILKVFQ